MTSATGASYALANPIRLKGGGLARKVGLSGEDVVDAAADIADAEGLEAVTLVSVATRLGVRSPSLYAHVDGLDGLRRALALRGAGMLAARLDAAVARPPAGSGLMSLARAYRRFARRHPGLYAAVQRAVREADDPELYRALGAAVEPLFRLLTELGVPEGERVHLARTIRSALHGFVLLERHRGFGMPVSVDASFDRLVALLDAGVQALVSAAPRA